jgi:outer membrane biosynthesis protein TonB
MRLRHLISLSLLLPALWQTTRAQTNADDYFHGGAQSYLSNNIPGALEKVESGLKLYPEDIKLKKLEELLKQQNQQQQQKQNQDQNQQQNNQQTNSPPQQPKEPDQKQDQDQKQNQPKPDQDAKDQRKDQPQEAPVKYAEGQMTPQQAKQLLDAEKNDETLMPVKLDNKAPAQRGAIKDW